MLFLKRAIRFLTSIYNIILTLILIGVFFLFQFVFEIELDQANVTWIYSSSMQTLAALIALLPISYGYYISNLDTEKNDNLDSYIIERLKSDVYHNMMTVIFFSVIVIVFNLISFFLTSNTTFAFVVALLTINCIGLISLYIYRLFDPNKVREILKEFDSSDTIDPNQEVISLDTFINEYLSLEREVKDFISNENDTELVDRLPLYDIVDNLAKDFPEINEHHETFIEIIFHRNNLIHNYIDTVVDFSKYTKIIELKELFQRYNLMFVSKRIFGNVVSIKNTVEKVVKEYQIDMQNTAINEGELPDDFKEEIVSLLHSYFVNDYYYTLSLDQASDADFEVIQSNYSERKLVGIDVKSIKQRNFQSIAQSFFKRIGPRFVYSFLINYDPTKKQFSIHYKTRDNEIRIVKI